MMGPSPGRDVAVVCDAGIYGSASAGDDVLDGGAIIEVLGVVVVPAPVQSRLAVQDC